MAAPTLPFELSADLTPAPNYQRLSIARDHAAYRALGHIDAAIVYARNGDMKMVLSILTSAREQYEKADAELQAAFNHNRDAAYNQARKEAARVDATN